MPAESKLERQITELAEQRGCYVRKFTSHHAGVPDRIIAKHGITLFLEVKAPGEKLRALQKDEIQTIVRTGGLATWVDNFDDASELIMYLIKSDTHKLHQMCKTFNFWFKS